MWGGYINKVIIIRDVSLIINFLRRYNYRSLLEKGPQRSPQLHQTLQNQVLQQRTFRRSREKYILLHSDHLVKVRTEFPSTIWK